MVTAFGLAVLYLVIGLGAATVNEILNIRSGESSDSMTTAIIVLAWPVVIMANLITAVPQMIAEKWIAWRAKRGAPEKTKQEGRCDSRRQKTR